MRARGWSARVWKKVRRRRAGCRLRRAIRCLTKRWKSAFSSSEGPVDPAGEVVLALGVVVAALGAQEFVAGQEHGDALGEQQGGDQVLGLAFAEGEDGRVVGRAFDAAVPGEVLVGAVAVVFAVGLVVLVVVADEVVEGEAVVAGDEVDGVQGASGGGRGRRSRRGGRRGELVMPSSPRQKRRTSSRKRPFQTLQRPPPGKLSSW